MPTLLHRHFCCLRADRKESAARLYELHQVQQVPVKSCAQLRKTGPHYPLSQHRCNANSRQLPTSYLQPLSR